MFKIYSKCNPHKLLHAINRIADFKERIDLVDANNFLQLATLKFNKGKTFRSF